MNAGNYKLATSSYPLALKPEANLKFAILLINQSINAAFYLVQTAQFLSAQDATLYKQLKYTHQKLLSIKLENASFLRHYWLKRGRSMLAQSDISTFTLPGYFRLKFGDADRLWRGFADRTQETESFYWKLPLPT
ncbi:MULTISPECIES: hypothetical protein [unclassified Nodularia (in: cyanobacteria)]|uniref:hypothetical protein n=1 Tax=unclassified Nodularia (in: cyanobacteria) TaxID=2656917 RepID=UPI00187EAF55|nr:MULTISPECIES: hypothetical protein [unclassified Nodularia (in: cyanobacteria)]MBE9202002.1 hypothetical protein [Nodularia sp. LEGE 06071]MCC2694288.1 hypothetical protein [Nodularia sp. LEGE 04288]